MPVVGAQYSTDWEVADLLARSLGGTLTCPVESAGSVVAPSDGTVTILRPDGTELLSASVTITDSIAQYAVSAATLANEDLSMNYQVIWALEMPDGVTHTARNELGVVRYAPMCPINVGHLTGRHRFLADTEELEGSGESSLQHWVTQAWNECQRWMVQRGNRAHLIVSASDLIDLVRDWALWLYFQDAYTSGNTKYERFATRYEKATLSRQESTTFKYAPADASTTTDRRRSTAPVTFLGTAGANHYEWPQ